MRLDSLLPQSLPTSATALLVCALLAASAAPASETLSDHNPPQTEEAATPIDEADVVIIEPSTGAHALLPPYDPANPQRPLLQPIDPDPQSETDALSGPGTAGDAASD